MTTVTKGTVSQDFWLLVFSWFSFPQAPEYTTRAVSNLQLKVHHRCRWNRWQMKKKNFNHKSFNYLFGHLWEVELTYRYIFAFKFTLRSQQPDIVPIICHLCHWRLWQICRRYPWHRWQILPPVSKTLAKLVVKFAAGVVDTGGAPWLANIFTKFCTCSNGFKKF